MTFFRNLKKILKIIWNSFVNQNLHEKKDVFSKGKKLGNEESESKPNQFGFSVWKSGGFGYTWIIIN